MTSKDRDHRDSIEQDLGLQLVCTRYFDNMMLRRRSQAGVRAAAVRLERSTGSACIHAHYALTFLFAPAKY